MKSLPTVFVSHGAPTLAIEPGATGPALAALGKELDRPKAILMVSAHWETSRPMASAVLRPDTIHDFGGFPQALYRLRYAAPGSPELAQRVKTLLDASGLNASLDRNRGLDHGAWVPLLYLYPDADVPVTQLSIQSDYGPDYHYRLGQALGPLADEGVLVIGSGSLTHNLSEFRGRTGSNQVAPYAQEFQQWVFDKVAANNVDALIDYRRSAPHAERAHPTEEHFLPFFVALGAAGGASAARRINDEMTFGALAMDTYVFHPRAGA
ncbi:MAG: dioxygenase [Proteobacteria bacterium]|nr:MAG: dioxygenase [Pseudomonadota bacterium]